jgi:hypothetical protein
MVKVKPLSDSELSILKEIHRRVQTTSSGLFEVVGLPSRKSLMQSIIRLIDKGYVEVAGKQNFGDTRIRILRATELGVTVLTKKVVHLKPGDVLDGEDTSSIGTVVMLSDDGKAKRFINVHTHDGKASEFPYNRRPSRLITSVFDLAI